MTNSYLSPNLLIVDDDPDIVRLLETITKKEFGDSLNVETHTDPTSALRRIDEGSVELLITDIDMPEINGLRLLREAKERNSATQVIVLTGYSTSELLLESAECGAIDFLHKPIDKQDLLEQISQAISRSLRWRKALALSWKQRRERATAN